MRNEMNGRGKNEMADRIALASAFGRHLEVNTKVRDQGYGGKIYGQAFKGAHGIAAQKSRVMRR